MLYPCPLIITYLKDNEDVIASMLNIFRMCREDDKLNKQIKMRVNNSFILLAPRTE